jgi:hypothetical protein
MDSPVIIPSDTKSAEKIVKLPLPEAVKPEAVKDLSWEKRAVSQLNEWDTALDGWMPNWVLQDKIDQLGTHIEDMFSSLPTFNSWLRNNGDGAWYIQLATYLVKLPLKAAHNIVNLLYNTIKGILYGATHPLKGLNAVAKQMVLLAHALTQPETWSKIGAGVIGAGLGQALIFGNPVSVIAMGLGAACAIAGVSFGALKAAIEAEEGKKFDAIVENVGGQFKQIPESLLTGFFMGLLIGGIKKMLTKPEPTDSVMNTSKTSAKKVQSSSGKQSLSLEGARAQAVEFTQQHNLPPPGHVSVLSTGTEFGPPGTIVVDYTQNTDFFMKSYFENFPKSSVNLEDFKMYLPPDGNGSLVARYWMEGSSIEEYWPTETTVIPLKDIL